jgi:hypothetical protein
MWRWIGITAKWRKQFSVVEFGVEIDELDVETFG